MSTLILLGKILFVALVFVAGYTLGFRHGLKTIRDRIISDMVDSMNDIEMEESQQQKFIDAIIKRARQEPK